jgi:hypothetical protein
MRKVLFIGHSHLMAVKRAYQAMSKAQKQAPEAEFLFLRDKAFEPAASATAKRPVSGASTLAGVDQREVRAAVEAAGADAAVLYLNGNGHNVFGLFRGFATPADQKQRALEKTVQSSLRDWLKFFLPILPRPIAFLLPPPPIESEQYIRDLLGGTGENPKPLQLEIEPASLRLELWAKQCAVTAVICREFGVEVIALPASVLSPAGFLAEDCCGSDPTHGNTEYGTRVFLHAIAQLARQTPKQGSVPVAAGSTPYSALPDHCFWRQSISDVPQGMVDPVVAPPFRIGRRDKVATAGSCFAQHISRRLRDSGYNYFVAERPPEAASGEKQQSYHDFSARYGNIYTARQLLQLFDRAFGYFRPVDRVWERRGGGFCDPFRPRIEPDGFASADEVLKDAQLHLAAVRRMFRQLDVFVFTLGLTECWMSQLDGAAFPVAPGVAGGKFDAAKYGFRNFGVAEIVADMKQFLAKLQLVNPAARVILTVSPVPLVATATGNHVLQATTYSKSVLRVAAGEIADAHDNVFYFPSYEIITGPHAAGGYFEADRRSVTAQGVDHVMRVFMSRLAEMPQQDPAIGSDEEDPGMEEAQALADALCEEEMLAR